MMLQRVRLILDVAKESFLLDPAPGGMETHDLRADLCADIGNGCRLCVTKRNRILNLQFPADQYSNLGEELLVSIRIFMGLCLIEGLASTGYKAKDSEDKRSNRHDLSICWTPGSVKRLRYDANRSAVLQIRSAIPASIAGVTRRVLWTRTKL